MPFRAGWSDGRSPGTPLPPVSNALAFWPMVPSSPSSPIRDTTGRGNDLVRYMGPAISDVPLVIGANSTGGQALTGRVAQWGNWKRLLTPAEKAALRGGESWPFSTTPSLRDATVFYPLDEASNSATYADATGRGNTLVRVGPTTQVSGPLGVGNAVHMAGASRLVLNPPTVDVQNGNIAQSISGWCYLDVLGASQQIFYGQLDFALIHLSNCLYYFSGTDRLQSDFCNNVDLYRNAVIVGNAAGAPGTGVWHHMLFSYDPETNLETLEIDGVADSLARVQQPVQLTGPNRAHFEVVPHFTGSGGATSGWDAVGAACHAYHTANADLRMGATSKSMWGWVTAADFAATQTIMGAAHNAAGAEIDWLIQIAGGLMYFSIGDGAGGLQFITVPLADTAWHAFICWYDSGANTININIDNGAHVASAVRTVGASGPLSFAMGALTQDAAPGGFAQQLRADVGMGGVSAGVPSGADITRLWAYGSGLYY